MLSCRREAFGETFTAAAIGYKRGLALSASMTFCRTEVKQNKKTVRSLLALKQMKETNASRQVRSLTTFQYFQLPVMAPGISFLLFKTLAAHTKPDKIC